MDRTDAILPIPKDSSRRTIGVSTNAMMKLRANGASNGLPIMTIAMAIQKIAIAKNARPRVEDASRFM
jgi:hypothetical protein